MVRAPIGVDFAGAQKHSEQERMPLGGLKALLLAPDGGG